MEVVGSATTMNDAFNLAPKADVMLVNVQMPDGMAFRLIRSVADAGLPIKMMAVGLTEAKEQVLPYIQAGATGYILKDDTVDDLLQRIRDVYAGQVRVSPGIVSALMACINKYAQLFGQVESRIHRATDLTTREEEVLELTGMGLTNQQIAERLFIEAGTVKNHIHNILHKLGANNRHEAAITWAVIKRGKRVTAVQDGALTSYQA